jgi:hypothetical protein
MGVGKTWNEKKETEKRETETWDIRPMAGDV